MLNCDKYIKILAPSSEEAYIFKALISKPNFDSKFQNFLHENFKESSFTFDGINQEKFGDLYELSVACLYLFLRENYTGPLDTFDFKDLDNLEFRKKSFDYLSSNGESAYSLCRIPFALCFSISGFRFLHSMNFHPTCSWWLRRALFLNQKLLDYPANDLKIEIMDLENQVLKFVNEQSDYIKGVYYAETALVADYYGLDDLYSECLGKSLAYLNLKFNLTGKLGRRTKFQTFDITQLVLDINNDKKGASFSHLPSKVPETLALNDDTLLEKVQLSDTDSLENNRILIPLEQCVILGHWYVEANLSVNFLRTRPKDEISFEQMMPYVMKVLETPNNWLVHTNALLLRSKLEFGKLRMVERATLQVQALVDQIPLEDPEFFERLQFVFQLPIPTRWELEKEMATMFKGLGMFKSALEIYEKHEMWDEAIACYIQIDQKAKAETIILNELAKNRTPKLLCIFGDLKNNRDYYDEAWEISLHKYSRAQRSLGFWYFNQKEFQKCLECLSLSLEINPLFEKVWFLKAFCEMYTDQLDAALSSFSYVISINHENSEAWNNIASILVKKERPDDALRAFKEAVKLKYDNVQIWENILTVSLSLGYIQDALNAVERIFEISMNCNSKALKILTEIAFDKEATNEFTISRLENFFEKITEKRNDAEIWKLFAEFNYLKNNIEKGIDCELKIYRICKALPFDVSEPSFIMAAECAISVCENMKKYDYPDANYQMKLILSNLVAKTRNSFPNHQLFTKIEGLLNSISQ